MGSTHQNHPKEGRQQRWRATLEYDVMPKRDFGLSGMERGLK